MKKVHYDLKIKGLSGKSGTISIRVLHEVLGSLLECAEREMRLIVQGESIKRGKLPAWLADSLNFTVTGIGKGSTVVKLDAPVLGETAAEKIQQQDLFLQKPAKTDTALSMLSKSVRDASANNLDSPLIDMGVLEGLLKFKPFISKYGTEIFLETKDHPAENFHLNAENMRIVDRIRKNTPEPAVYVVSGQCDVIKHRTKRFQLAMSNGQTLSGIIDSDYLSVEDMRGFWGKKVSVKGMVYFSPGGKARFVEARTINIFSEGDRVFEKAPEPYQKNLFHLSERPSSQAPWEEIWGACPGDEPIEQLLTDLRAG